MEPWAAAAGRLVDQGGEPMTLSFSNGQGGVVSLDDPDGKTFADIKINNDGEFRIDRMIPGQKYTVEIIRTTQGSLHCPALKALVLRAGETRELGDVRTTP